MYGYDWDNNQPLSARGNENTACAVERTPHTLLRPIFINAVEAGYAYSQCDKDRRLNVRGVTIALFHFISKGHQALALLPYCFKSYPDKSSCWTELNALFKMNLVEFTPGFGSDKYVEVNRILATRASEVGGCVVARSQMHNIVEERPNLVKTVEKRLLMPSFNGSDIIFPVDGPLGRNGPTLQETLECSPSDDDWGRCSHHQMTLGDQRIWLHRLSHLVFEQVSWRVLSTAVQSFSPSIPLPPARLPPRPPMVCHSKVQPPETNPIDGKGYSFTRAAIRRANPDVYGGVMSFRDSMTARDEMDLQERADPFMPEYMRTGKENIKPEPRFEDMAPPQPNYLGNPDSIYRIREGPSTLKFCNVGGKAPRRTRSKSPVLSPSKGRLISSLPPPPYSSSVSSSRRPRSPSECLLSAPVPASSTVPLPASPPGSPSVSMSSTSQTPRRTAEQERKTKLAIIFGWEKACRVVSKYPRVANVSQLVEFALNMSDIEVSHNDNNDITPPTTDNEPDQVTQRDDTPPNFDLIDFSSEPAAEDEASETPQTSLAVSPPSAPIASLLD